MFFLIVGVIFFYEFVIFSGSNIIFLFDWGFEVVYCVFDFFVVLVGRFLLYFWFYVCFVMNFYVYFSFFEVW